jgi:predicted molibdopterin-dependent oxidoreductase YjgC
VAALKLQAGERVKLSSRQGVIEVPIKATQRVGTGELFLHFHFAEAPVNRLTSDTLDPYSRIPGFKHTPCRVEKIK